MKNRAFTLAEVLLTLAIIGVVAALTIPAVVIKVQQDQYVVGLKKAFNTLKSVEREAVQENGPMENWTWVNTLTDFDKYFKPHFDILKDCGTTTDEACFHGANEVKYLDGSKHENNYSSPAYYKFIASDAIAYQYYSDTTSFPNSTGYFNVDVNGKKGPNTIGRDIFTFYIFRKAGIKPRGALDNANEETRYTSSEVDAECGGGGQGRYCAAKVLSEGAMNY